MARGETALVTGYPALRARYVLDAILREQTDLAVIALVHEHRFEEAEERLRALPEGASSRVTLKRGDPAAMDFGLGGAEYLELVNRVDVVHALYSSLDPAASEEDSGRINIAAAREIVELGRSARQSVRFVWYSSVFVSGNRKGRVLESELEAGQSFRNRTERTLAIAERMLRKSGLSVAVLRSGHLVGATRTGEIEALTGPPYPLVVLLASAAEDRPLPLPPGWEAPLPLTPVDHLAAFGAFVARVGAFGRTFHVIERERVTVRRFLELAAERSGKKIDPGFNPTALTRFLLGKPAARLLPQNARGIWDVLATLAEYDQKHVQELAESGAPDCPPLDSYLGALIDHVRARIQDGTLVLERPDTAPWLVT